MESGHFCCDQQSLTQKIHCMKGLVPNTLYDWKVHITAGYIGDAFEPGFPFNVHSCDSYLVGTLHTRNCAYDGPGRDAFMSAPVRFTGSNLRQCGEGCGYHSVHPGFQQWESGPNATAYQLCSPYTPDLDCTQVPELYPRGCEDWLGRMCLTLLVHPGEYYRWGFYASRGSVRLSISTSPFCAQPPCCCRAATCPTGSLPCSNPSAKFRLSIGVSTVNFTFEPGLDMNLVTYLSAPFEGGVFLRLDAIVGEFKLNHIDVTYVPSTPTKIPPSPTKRYATPSKRPVTPSKRPLTPSRRPVTPSKRPATPSK